jgi:hypothetical protein
MKYRAILLVTLLAVAILIVAQACSKAGNISTSSSTSKSDFVSETRHEVDKSEVTPVMNVHHLKIKKLHLAAGELTLQLLTPSGDVQWKETFTAPANFKQTRELEVTPGTWVLEIDLKNATGDYDIQWQASN